MVLPQVRKEAFRGAGYRGVPTAVIALSTHRRPAPFTIVVVAIVVDFRRFSENDEDASML